MQHHIIKIISFFLLALSCGCHNQLYGKDGVHSLLPGQAELLPKAKAFWITEDLILWPTDNDKNPAENSKYRLIEEILPADPAYENKHGDFKRFETTLKVVGKFNQSFPEYQKYPYLKNYIVLTSRSLAMRAEEILKNGRFFVGRFTDGGAQPAEKYTLQTFGVIDKKYFYSGHDLGVSFNGNDNITLKLWAPTARLVRIHLYDSPDSSEPIITSDLTRTPKGVWSLQGNSSWNNLYYLYEVKVYVPATGLIENNLVTDPYSVSLSINGQKSQIIDINDPRLKPAGWDYLQKPILDDFDDIVLYELHLRDFSALDSSLSNGKFKGTFLGFTDKNSFGMKHLKSLADGGISHVHLLPVFDFASVNEDKSTWKKVDHPYNNPNLEDLQAEVTKIKDLDGFNWGYDPVHYNVPEGSYSTDPNGPARILEMREMVKALSEAGLRVVMDVVFNHTYASGQDKFSVFDKIVPDYFYRLDLNGEIQRTTCCPDTASEHRMMEKLMVDSMVHWAKNYKIDGFRIDIMGHHTKANVLKARRALNDLTVENDGVDGKKIYMYGEGWKFGSLDAILPKESCNQMNAYGLGIGTFNDRLRDRANGGNFESKNLPNQGFVNGLYYDFNGIDNPKNVPSDLDDQKALLFDYTDIIKLSLAGNLRDYRFLSWNDKLVYGKDLLYFDQHAGYTASPRESINYITSHDNYALWDFISAKAPFNTAERNPKTSTVEERVRMQWLAISLIAFGQGIPFFDAGIELLRSKSGDGNSYNSGDIFNRLDFSGSLHNFGIGLPPAESNKDQWDFWRPRLVDNNLHPLEADIEKTKEYFMALLRIRRGSPLFRLRTFKEVQKRVSFLNAKQHEDTIPGVILMNISDNIKNAGPILDPKRKRIVVAINAIRETISFAIEKLRGVDLALHRELLKLAEGDNPIDPTLKNAKFEKADGRFTIPPRTTLVFEERR